MGCTAAPGQVPAARRPFTRLPVTKCWLVGTLSPASVFCRRCTCQQDQIQGAKSAICLALGGHVRSIDEPRGCRVQLKDALAHSVAQYSTEDGHCQGHCPPLGSGSQAAYSLANMPCRQRPHASAVGALAARTELTTCQETCASCAGIHLLWHTSAACSAWAGLPEDACRRVTVLPASGHGPIDSCQQLSTAARMRPA